ncbi:Fic family protein [Xenophilus arseniciresistens]|uniref:Fic family protein n=1 Tax=Xenophilus arseniciresistens TaxID=1283306 RepID=A0AAE3SX56_9BURK|nr:Fic family protein [Xenophilus arseniciresistens]MDA7414797.1 Fic family protein [Xenophilus arseniciresistens]
MPAFPVRMPARVAPVTRVTPTGEFLSVPEATAPSSDDALDHLLFAFKHEGMNLQVALLALKTIPETLVAQAFCLAPGSRFARTAAYLWELAHGRPMASSIQMGPTEIKLPLANGAYHKLFDETRYITGRVVRDTRWRIDFNGLGTPDYCLSVERTPALEALLAEDILAQVAAFVDSADPAVLDRTVRWAYLSETEGSFEIERERPSANKAEAFAALLARARQNEPVTPDYLVALQQVAVTNPLDRAEAFRTHQNWLRNGMPGVLGVTYVPPPPEMLPALMAPILALANDHASPVDVLVRASLVSFAFVMAHPFMDGNGRLSRFLFHKVACSDARLASGLVLPVSVAMKRHEHEYLQALQSFSRPARALWEVTQISDARFDVRLRGDPLVYRYWDATAGVEFGLRMAGEALRKDLTDEMAFLLRYDAVYRAVNDAVDMNNTDLVLFVRAFIQNGGLSKHRRRQLLAKGHPEALVDAAVVAATEAWALLSDGDEPGAQEASA